VRPGGQPAVHDGGGLRHLLPAGHPPAAEAAQEHRLKLSRLKKGDEVVTAGGLIGTISALTDTILTLEVADKVRVRVLRSQIANLLSEAPAEGGASTAEKGK
jgi:preprotein translocase YajC subunit